MVWQTETGELLSTLTSQAYTGAFFPSAISFSPDGAHLAIGSNGLVGLWSLSDWSEALAWQGHNSSITAVAFSPGNRLLASGAEDGNIVLADPSSGEVLRTLTGPEYVMDLSFSDNGKWIISTAIDGTLRFWGVPPSE